MSVTNLPVELEFIKVLTRAVRSMAAGSMESAGNSGKNDDLYSTFNLDSRNIGGVINKKLMNTFCNKIGLFDLLDQSKICFSV